MFNNVKNTNSKSKIFFKQFYFYLIILGTSLNSYAEEIKLNIFFTDDRILLEKENSLVSSPYRIQVENLSRIENIQGASLCRVMFSMHQNTLVIKDPREKFKSYMECTLFLANQDNSNKKTYRIGMNRTFLSWCQMRKSADNGVQKTVDAVMNIVQATDCKDSSIKESLFNARMMNLAGQDIDDLSPIGSLIQLRALWLDNNEVSDLKPLSSLKNLIVLSLSNNHISDIQILQAFKNLQWLFLSANSIEKIDSLTRLDKIKVLSIKNNNIESIKPLFQFNSKTLILANGNPFQKDACKDFNSHKIGQSPFIWLEKLCSNEVKKKITKIDDSSI
ncbi:leucine-rich repeat domain-containing protein [Silvanigrella aquatica]|uniref:Leucine-rich repeat domain-containing protein n=1 Tax=Silvanigrella aquatica TaxID=1915309 RepID=A0A1L4D081_9BACT|nr:leucine-rich repeat domain-containing protein [Silvanigrella aquatica]APJ03613.1 hypothetical protein AXG55_06710 [Silvanigrella aquatica]